jgi:type IV secretory pathway TraG/TraD family ATPase VirD4
MENFDLDTPLIHFGHNGDSAFTIRSAVESVQIFGGVGSGKSSGSGRRFAEAFLRVGMGGLVLTTKPDERKEWIKYCIDTGRLHDLVIIEPGGKYGFDFLEYISTTTDSNKAISDNILQTIKVVIRANQEQSGGQSEDPFWENAMDQLLTFVLELGMMAYGKIGVQLLYDMLQSLPKANDSNQKSSVENDRDNAFTAAFKIIKEKADKAVDAWYNKLSEKKQQEFKDDRALYRRTVLEKFPEARMLKLLDTFFFDTLRNLSSKTRSVIEFVCSNFLFRLLREPLYSLFCAGKLNVRPEDALDGKIILINLPVKIYNKAGSDIQILFKYLFQIAMEKRDISKNDRPVFLWSDEAQTFIHEHDPVFQATARSSRVATVYITQNLNNYYAAMGGQKSEYKVKSFMGVMATKIFHANADIETNRFASDLIGEAFFTDPSMNMSITKESFSQGQNTSIKLQKIYRPEEFMALKTGGPFNNHNVEAIIHKQGDPLTKNGNHAKINFKQKINP